MTDPSTRTGSGRANVLALALMLLVVPIVGTVAPAPTAIDPSLWMETAKITPDDADDPGAGGRPHHAGVHFGSSVAIDGDTMVVGTAFDDCEFVPGVYVFERSHDGGWNQTARLLPSYEFDATCSGFGSAVDVDEQAGVVVVGNRGYDIPAEKNAGAVHIYERASNGTWMETAWFEGRENTYKLPALGYSVGVSGTVVVAGTPRDDVAGPQYSGSISTFERKADGTWETGGTFTSPEPHRWGHFGSTLAIAGDIMVVGATGDAAVPGDRRGAAYVFERTDEAWRSAATLGPPEVRPYESPEPESFGFSVATDGDTVVVGVVGWENAVENIVLGERYLTDTGRAYVFENEGAGWERVAELAPGDHMTQGNFGRDVGVDAGVIAVGADEWGPELRVGAVHVYEQADEGWLQTGRVMARDTGPPDNLGSAVAVSQGTIVAGAPFDDNRRDGTPPPLDDFANLPVLGNNVGRSAGSVYAFELIHVFDPLPPP